jgi:signal transduction histidine kinase
MSSGWTSRLRRTLGFRLALWYSALFVVSSLAVTSLTYVLLEASLEQRDHDLIRSTLARYVSQYELGGLAALNQAIATDARTGRHERLFVRVLGRGGAEAVFFTMPADWGEFDLDKLETPGLRAGQAWARLPGHGGTALEVASVRLEDGTVFQVGKSTEARVLLLTHFRALALVLLVTTVVVGLLGGALLTHWALQPLRRLIGIVRGIVDTGHLASRVPTRQTGDPLDELGALFNGMLDRIETLIAAMRGSLDNVAHDLRTPLTRLRGIAETTLQADGDAPTCREALADCLEESERIEGMLTTLMDISEAETGTMRLQLEAVELAPLLDQVRELYADLAEEKGLRLEVHAAPGLVAWADPQRLRQVVANLVDNAVKYTQEGGRIAVVSEAAEAGVSIEVSDTGIGIPAGDLPRVWERLYRGDASRSERGLGLGLSLIRAVVEAHSGNVDVRSAAGEGSTFRVWLPAPSARSDRHPNHGLTRRTVDHGPR